MIEQKYIDNFFSKVDMNSSPEGCWEWTAGKFTDGYGAFGYKGKAHKTHRISWMIHNGEIPDNLFVCHHCDNKSCCNPDHLFLGNHQENMMDRNNKNRQARHKGESNGRSKLTENQVIQIRKEYEKENTTIDELAAKYNVTFGNISHIINYKSWKHL